MPCNLTADRQVLTMIDQSGETYQLYYRNLTNADRLAFNASLFEKRGKRPTLKENIFAEQVALGKKLCTGFSEGYFMDGDAFLSSNPALPYYRADWKDLLERARPTDLQQIALVATRPASPVGEEEADDHATSAESADEVESDAPLSSSSEDSSTAAPTGTDATAGPETANG